ncbi:MAG: hypothetical protein ABMA64_37090 [Myxococcota bacterium]
MDYAVAEAAARDVVRSYVEVLRLHSAKERRRLVLGAEEVSGGWVFTFGILTRAAAAAVTLDDKDPRVVSTPWIRVHTRDSGSPQIDTLADLSELLGR